MDVIFGIIWFIFMFFLMFSVGRKSKKQQPKQRNNARPNYQAPQNAASYQQRNAAAYQQQNAVSYQQPRNAAMYQQQPQRRTMTDADRARLEEYRRRKANGDNIDVQSQPIQSSQDLDANRQRHFVQPDIVERAKANSRQYAQTDVALQELETDHKHSERVSPAVADCARQRRHEEPAAREEEFSGLGTVEDLMIKGYSGNLSFERDFVGEAQDMLLTFTLPG